MNERTPNSFLDISNFGEFSLGQPAQPAAPSPRDQKASSVQEASALKRAVFGDRAQQREAATAVEQRAALAQDEGIQDLLNLDPLEFAEKYGSEANANRHRFSEALRELQDMKADEQTLGEAFTDGAINTGLTVANMAAGGASALTAISDEVWAKTIDGLNWAAGEEVFDEPAPFTPNIAEGMNALDEFARGFQSELYQERRAQNSLEGQMFSEENEAQYQDEIESAEGAQQVGPWLRKQGREIADTVRNVADDPMMQADLVNEGLASLIPVAAASRVAATANATRNLTARGMSKEAAEEFLTTAAGREMLEEAGERAAPWIMSVTESGSAVNQAQMSVLTRSEEEMMESPEYAAMREEGKSHEEAQALVARDVGTTAGLASAPGSLIAGKIAAPFAANPLSAGRTGFGAVPSAGRNVASETVEEFIQEGNATLATNYAQRDAGFDVALDEGVASAATLGALGGVASSGISQAPATAAGVLNGTTSAVVTGAQSAMNAREAQVSKRVDASNPAGTAAQATASRDIQEAGQALIQSLPEAPAPVSETEEAPAPKAAAPALEAKNPRETIASSLYLNEDEVMGYGGIFPAIAEARQANPEQPIERTTMITAASNMLADPKADTGDKMTAALVVLSSMDEMRKSTSDDLRAAAEADETAKSALASLEDRIGVIESGNHIQKAEDALKDLTPDDVKELIDTEALTNPDTDPAMIENIAHTLRMIGRVNPEAVAMEDYDLALNQLGGGKGFEILREKLAVVRDIAMSFFQSKEKKAQIEADQDRVISEMPGDLSARMQARRYATKDIVREQIMTGGNRDNGLPALTEHRRRIMDAAESGHIQEAQDALEQLQNFAQSQINKVEAYNRSAESGKGQSDKQKHQAFGPFGWFEQSDAWVDVRRPNSVALVREVAVDAETAVNLATSLAQAYGLALPDGGLKVPALHAKIERAARKMPAAEAQTLPEAEQRVETRPTQTEEPVAETQPEETEDEDLVVIEDIDDVEPVTDQPAPQQSAPQPETIVEEETVPEVVEEVPTPAEPVTETAEEVREVSEEAPAPKFFETLSLPRDSEGKNVLLTAFTEKPGSTKLTATEDPAGEFLSGKVDADLTSEEQAAANDLLTDSMPSFIETFEKAMNDLIERRTANNEKLNAEAKNGKTDRPSWKEMLESGTVEGLLGYDNGLPFNFISDVTGDGKFRIEPRVIQATFMAAMEWTTQNAKRGGLVRKDEQISQLFGMGRNGRVTAEMRSHAQFGTPVQTAVEQIAGSIEQLLGVEARDDVTIAETQGLFRSMAANALEALLDKDENGFSPMESSSIEYTIKDPVTGKPAPRQMISIRVNKQMADYVEPLANATKPFSKAFLAEYEPERLIGKPSDRVTSKQLGNRFSEVSDKARKVIDRLQRTTHYVNQPMMDLVDALGDDVVGSLLGFKEVNDEVASRTNKVHLTSIEGKNQSITGGLRETRLYTKEAGQLPIFFKWAISSVGRLQQQGPVTPQGDKIAREIISATNAVIDLTDPQMQDALWLAVAQSLDISVEKMSHEDAIQEAQDLVQGALWPAVEMVQTWLQGEDLDRDGFKTAVEASGIEVTAKALHAIMTVARANEAFDTEAETTFQTSLALEADGKTDGPINAMIHMGVGEFTEEDIERFAKGGLFFGSEQISLNEYIRRENLKKGTKAEDLYHLAAARFQETLSDMLQSQDTGMQDMLQVLNSLLPDFDLEKDNPVGRGLVKNPLTVFLYGSSEGGIANKMAGAVANTLYQTLSEVAAGVKDGKMKSWKDHPMFSKNPDLVDQLGRIVDPNGSTEKMDEFLSDAVGAELSAEAFQNLANAIEENFASPMLEAVDEVTGGLQANMKYTQSVAQVQTLIFQDLFAQAQDEAGTEKGSLPSQGEIDDTFVSQMNVAPIYQSTDQSFQISKGEKDTLDKSVSTTFGGQLKTKANGLRPADASVKISPYLTIGTGDGQMMLNIYGDGDQDMDRTLPVFDGVEIAVDNIKTASEQINKSVWDGWMGTNVYQVMDDGWAQTKERLTPAVWNKLGAGTKAQIARSLGIKKGDPVTRDMVLEHGERLKELAASAQLRKDAMAAAATQIDHMAGAEAPHSNPGSDIGTSDPLDFAAIANMLNNHMAANRVAAAQTAPKQSTYPQGPVSSLMKAIKKAGTSVEGHDAVELKGAELVRVLKVEKSLSPEQADLLERLLKNDDTSAATTYYFGSAEALSGLRADKHPTLGNKPIELGLTYVKANVSFITNQAPETLLHEMIHAKTGRVIVEHYRSPEKSPEHVRIAMKNLEGLMEDVMSLDPLNEAMMVLQRELNREDLGPDAKMAEFVAYVMSNQDLIETTQKLNSYRKLTRAVKQGLARIRQLLGLRGPKDNSILAQVKFNTEVMIADPLPQTEAIDTDLELSQAYGDDPRLAQTESLFTTKLDTILKARYAQMKKGANSSNVDGELARGEHARLIRQGQNSALRSVAAGYRMNPREIEVYKAVHATILSGVRLDPAVMNQVSDLYGHVQDNLKAEMLVEAGIEADRAEQMVDHLTGKAGISKMSDGKSDLMATFIAMSQASPELRGVLSKMKPPKIYEGNWKSVDGVVNMLSEIMVSLITRLSIKRPDRALHISKELDRLSAVIGAVQKDRKILATMSKLEKGIDKLNHYGSTAMARGAEAVADFAEQKSKTTDNRLVKTGLDAAALVTSFGSAKTAAAQGERFTTMLNHVKGFDTLRAGLNDLRGQTKTNAPLLRLVNRVKASVDAIRQDFRERVPSELAGEFSRKLEGREWSDLHSGMGTTDILTLGMNGATELMGDPGSLQARISEAEETVLGLSSRSLASRYNAKAKALAIYMTSKQVTSENLLRNPKAIANLFGEAGRPQTAAVTDDLVDAIEKLTALYAYRELPDATKETLKDLVEKEPEGMKMLTGFHASVRQMEKEKVLSGDPKQDAIALNNGWSGWLPGQNQGDTRVIVAEDSRHEQLIKTGHVRLAPYNGASTSSRGKESYYITTTGGRSPFRQGVAQSVHDTWSGVNAKTGQTLSGDMAGLILGAKVTRMANDVRTAQRGSLDGLKADLYPLPIFDDEGNITGYERPMDQKMLTGVEKDTHLGRMLGVWSGRIFEEDAANKFNVELVKTLKDIHEQAISEGRGDEFVNVADSKDPIVKDAWETLGFRIKEEAEEIFGQKGYLPIRQDMVNDAIGFRQASITDAWTGQSRWNDEMQKGVQKLSTLMMGENAYKYLAKTEDAVQYAVSQAKTMIIVKSVFVGVANLSSNFLHLSLRGVSAPKMLMKSRSKFLEIREFTKNRQEIQKLQIAYAARLQDGHKAKALEAKIQALEDANGRMSISPLIASGEFSTITEDLTEADVAIRDGKWIEYLERLVDRLPGWTSTAAKNALITKDTELFKALNRMVQYGDFVAKAVLYDHLMEKGMDETTVLDEIREEFVQYNRLPGRGRDYAESVGLMWFWNYKLRIMKVMTKMVRERPFSALMVMGGAGPNLDMDTVGTGSLLGNWADGSLGFSLGPQMGLNAPTLNPWWSLTN